MLNGLDHELNLFHDNLCHPGECRSSSGSTNRELFLLLASGLRPVTPFFPADNLQFVGVDVLVDLRIFVGDLTEGDFSIPFLSLSNFLHAFLDGDLTLFLDSRNPVSTLLVSCFKSRTWKGLAAVKQTG